MPTCVSRRCNSYRIPNVFTRGEQCKPDFTRHLLHQKSEQERLYRRECRKCGFLWLSNCCDDVYIGDGWRYIYLYSCIKNITNEISVSGATSVLSTNIFGGYFSSEKVNPVTMSKDCPVGFTSSPGPEGLTLCFSERAASIDKRLPAFGGIFSCSEGNPASRGKTKECPQGYSLYSMTTLMGSCIMSVCFKFEIQSESVDITPVVLPPFTQLKDINLTTEVNGTMKTGVITARKIGTPDIIQLHTSHGGSGVARIQLNILATILLLLATAIHSH